MASPDLNLLLTLDAVLTEGSVAGAARRLHLSPSAMSRALARLRETTGDPLLVRAGRGLVPTPRASELRDRVALLVQETEAVLRPGVTPDLRRVVRTFTLRTTAVHLLPHNTLYLAQYTQTQWQPAVQP
jgi:DNA-binding transcriptional LysR family regulator